MRWATYRRLGSDEDRAGLVVDDQLYALPPGTTLLEVLGGESLAEAGDRAGQDPAEVVPLDEVELRAPVPHPPSLRDFYAFEDHVRTARETRGLPMDPDWYELPVFYFSSPHRVVGPGEDVAVPPGCRQLDFELEVAAVVGRAGSDLHPDDAENHIAGFTVMNDWSARDLQKR